MQREGVSAGELKSDEKETKPPKGEKLSKTRKTHELNDEERNVTSARETFRDDVKPFSGMLICCTGITNRRALFAKAKDLGASYTNDLTDQTTHLVANAPGGAKYQVACQLDLPICTSDWITKSHRRWLAGKDIDPDEAVMRYSLRPLKGFVVFVTRLAHPETRQYIIKSVTRLGAKYQAHLDQTVTHLLVTPDGDGCIDPQELEWVESNNAKRREEPQRPSIRIVWDVWPMACADKNRYVPEAEFEYHGLESRPELSNSLLELFLPTPMEESEKVDIPALNSATLPDHRLSASLTRDLAHNSSNAPHAQILGPGDGMEVDETQSRSFEAKVFTGKRFALIGGTCTPTLCSVLLAHGAMIVDGAELSDPKGENKAVEFQEVLRYRPEQVDYYVVRLANESAKLAIELDLYSKFRTDCWAEQCIFEDRICPCEENVTFAPLRLELPIPGVENIQLHLTGLYKEQETMVRRLAKVIGITITKSFEPTNTHLLCPLRSGIKYDIASQSGIAVVDMDWLYEIAREGRISDADIAQMRLKHARPTSGVGSPGMSYSEETSGRPKDEPTSPLVATESLPVPPELPSRKESEQMSMDVNECLITRSDGAYHNPLLQVPVLDIPPESITKIDNFSVADNGWKRHLGVHQDQIATSSGVPPKKHRREESTHSDQPWKRNRSATVHNEAREGTNAGGSTRACSVTEGFSSLSLTRLSDIQKPDYRRTLSQ